jgi:hypothetical protein
MIKNYRDIYRFVNHGGCFNFISCNHCWRLLGRIRRKSSQPMRSVITLMKMSVTGFDRSCGRLYWW